MRQELLRKTLTGDWEAFTFPKKSRFFIVKNLSENAVLATFENDATDAECFKIPAGTSEEVAISFDPIDREQYQVNTVWVKGTGEVEVQCRDTFHGRNEETVSDGVLVLADRDIVENDAAIIPNAEIENDTLIV